jgi:hypothetical protein
MISTRADLELEYCGGDVELGDVGLPKDTPLSQDRHRLCGGSAQIPQNWRWVWTIKLVYDVEFIRANDKPDLKKFGNKPEVEERIILIYRSKYSVSFVEMITKQG